MLMDTLCIIITAWGAQCTGGYITIWQVPRYSRLNSMTDIRIRQYFPCIVFFFWEGMRSYKKKNTIFSFYKILDFCSLNLLKVYLLFWFQFNGRFWVSFLSLCKIQSHFSELCCGKEQIEPYPEKSWLGARDYFIHWFNIFKQRYREWQIALLGHFGARALRSNCFKIIFLKVALFYRYKLR